LGRHDPASGAYEIDAMGEVLSYTFVGQSGVHQFLTGQRETWGDTAYVALTIPAGVSTVRLGAWGGGGA
jgi:hypothetical protein